MALFFVWVHNRLGLKKTVIARIASSIPAFLIFPVANALARTQGYGIAVWMALGLQCIVAILPNLSSGQSFLCNLQTFFFSDKLTFDSGAVFIFIAAASPSRAAIGATNGLSQVCSCYTCRFWSSHR
jgi:hypothetical protein